MTYLIYWWGDDEETGETLVRYDPRSGRELVKLINTKAFIFAADKVPLPPGKRQWANFIRSANIVTVLLDPPEPLIHLAPREYDVLWRLAEGKRAKRIAAEMGITPHTVYDYLDRMKRNFNAENRAHLIQLAVLHGFL